MEEDTGGKCLRTYSVSSTNSVLPNSWGFSLYLLLLTYFFPIVLRGVLHDFSPLKCTETYFMAQRMVGLKECCPCTWRHTLQVWGGGVPRMVTVQGPMSDWWTNVITLRGPRGMGLGMRDWLSVWVRGHAQPLTPGGRSYAIQSYASYANLSYA